MAHQAGWIICPKCNWANTPGTRYCAHCGEPVDPQLLAELQRLYTVLIELDRQVADGLGSGTVESLRDTFRERYLSQRTPQRPAAAATTPPPTAAPVTTPQQQAPTPVTTPVAAPVAATVIASVVAPIPAQPHGPVFSWRAFIAEQAIAVMAYLGGFLLLIATLTFEVGGWQALPDIAKLGGVLLVYLIFGVLGISLRHVASLRTVSRVYLGVFALMTPLAALAVYRFELQARGFSVSGMICLAAAYTTVIYLALAIRTGFVTYAYLGWAALLLSALAIPPWAALALIWWIPVISLVALVLLAPHTLMRWRGAATGAWLEAIEPSGVQISAGAAALGLLATGALAAKLLLQIPGGAPADQQRAALALAACALVPLAVAWSRTARSFPFLANHGIISFLDWLIAATAALAALAVAAWLQASPAEFVYVLAGSALVEGSAVEILRWRAPTHVALRRGVQILAATLVSIGALQGLTLAFSQELYRFIIPAPNNTTPLLIACAVGVALGLVFALRGSLASVTPWGLMAGSFLLIGALTVFHTAIPGNLLTATTDRLPDALEQITTLLALVALALVALALGLRAAPLGSRPRMLRVAVEITALASALMTLLGLSGHSRAYNALLVSVLALAALLLTRLERRPIAVGIWATFFGAIASLIFIQGNLNGVAVVALPVALALATLALTRLLGRSYTFSVYLVTLIATVAAFLQLIFYPNETTAHVAPLALGLGGWMALAVAATLTLDALMARSPGWSFAPALVALLAIYDARTLWPAMGLTLALAGVGALLRWRRGAHWEIAWHAVAVVASIFTLNLALQSSPDPAARALGMALLFALVAWLIARQERQPLLTAVSAPYTLVALWQAGALPITANQQLAVTFSIALLVTVAGMATRLRLGRAWALALYATAFLGAWITASRVSPYPANAGLLEAILLVFAALAFVAALLEETPWAALAPAAFAAAAALAQPDARALLPLALGLAAAAFAVSRTRGASWSLPLYGAAMVAAVASTWQGRSQGGTFEVIALVTLALAAWLLAALESRPDALLIAYTFAALAVSSAARAFSWDSWAAILTFAALAWVFEFSRLGWARIPWLRERHVAWLAGLGRTAESQAAWRDPRRAGQRIARGAAVIVAGGVVIGGWLAPQSFATQTAPTQALAVALLSLTALLTRFGWGSGGWRPARYLAGEALALCVTWELRWLGAANVQAWIIAPGSAQLIIGALLPADTRIHPPRWVAQAFLIAGALILTLPTLGQSVTESVDWQWRYALLLAVEALALTLLGMGLRNRILALTGSAFVGVAAIRGAIIAVQQNLPVPLVIAVFALALMGLATWLSLRARQAPHAPTTP